MITGPITITVADPGYDWTAWFVIGGASVAIALVAALFYYGFSRFTSSRKVSNVLEVIGSVLLIISTIVFAVFMPLLGGGIGWSVRGDIITDARDEAFAEKGIVSISTSSDSDLVSAVSSGDGRLITGLMIEPVPLTWHLQELTVAGGK